MSPANGIERQILVLPDGRELAVEQEGRGRDGIPVLIIRPLGGPMRLWGRFRDELARGFRVIAFDRSGVGDSSRARLGTTTRDMAREAVLVLDHLGVSRAHVFGVSLGGMVATWLAVDAPERVARLCLASTPRAAVDLAVTAIGEHLALAACLLRRSSEVEAGLARAILSRQFRAREPERVEQIEAAVRGRRGRRLEIVKQAAAAALHDARRELATITAPTLVLAGEYDELLRDGAQEALARAIPGAVFEVVREAGHAITLEQPMVAAERVARFFANGS